MQIRKGLVAAATAAAVMTSGITVATAEDKPQVANNAPKEEEKPAPAPAPAKEKEEKKESSSKNMTAKEIQDWIAVVTALIGLLGTLFAFGQKYLKP